MLFGEGKGIDNFLFCEIFYYLIFILQKVIGNFKWEWEF